MRGAVLYGPRDLRFEEREALTIRRILGRESRRNRRFHKRKVTL